MKVRARASTLPTWFPWYKKANKLTSKNSIPDVVDKDKIFHANSFPEVHSHACLIQVGNDYQTNQTTELN